MTDDPPPDPDSDSDPLPVPASPGPRAFESRFRARSYELDAFDHVNHAVFLNWCEQARFDVLEAGGFPMERLAERGWAVVVARIEVDYREEVRMGDEVAVRTRVAEVQRSSMTLVQAVVLGGDDRIAAEARVVVVWLKDGRPARIPEEVRRAFGVPDASS